MRIETEDGTFNYLLEGEGEPLLLLHGMARRWSSGGR